MKCLSVKKISFISLLAIALSSFGVFCLCRPASALEFDYAFSGDINAADMLYFDGTTVQYRQMTPVITGNNTRFFRYEVGVLNVDRRFRGFQIYFPKIKNNSIVHFSWRLSSTGSSYPPVGFEGLGGSSNISIINRSCVPVETATDSANIESLRFTQCDYWFYAKGGSNEYMLDYQNGLYGYIEFDGEIWFGARTTPIIDILGRYDWIELESGLSSSDIQNLSNNITSAIEDLQISVESSGGVTPAQIQDATETAIKNTLEEEKEEYEDQAEENETSINSDSSAAQSTATSLLGVVGQFISTLTSAQPTNCNLNGNLIPHLPLGNLDLCQNSPPAAITLLGSLVLIAFVVPLAYHTVKRMLALIGSFQS